MEKDKEIVVQVVPPQGFFPNNPKLALIIYRDCLLDTEANEIIKVFANNGWQKAWIDSIFPFHHYHSNTHEVLGISEGSCEVQFGGEQGQIIEVNAADVVIIPAGVSHKKINATKDFQCVGAYPFDIPYDMHYAVDEAERKSSEKNIENVSLPLLDPVYGKDGYLFEYWNNKNR